MREVKLRAWVTTYSGGNIMADVLWINFREHVILADNGLQYTDYKLMQFTGLCDRNGREIYEGDIVRFSPYWVEHPWTSRVVWGREYAGHVVKGKADDSEEDVLDYEMVEDAEVIGNIYDNPELLK